MRTLSGMLCGLLLVVGATPAWADWSKSFDVKGEPQVVVRMNDGHMVIRSWSERRIQATLITTGYDENDYEVIPRQNGDRVEIEVRKRHQIYSWNFGVRTFRLEVTMPAKGSVDAETKDGHVEAYNLTGTIQVHTGDGHISGHDLEGILKFRTGDGHISLNRVKGSLSAHTGDGHVTVDGRFDELDVDTGDGHVTATVQSGSVMKNNWKVSTRDGRVNVELPGQFSGDLDVHTGDGRVRADLHDARNLDNNRNELRARLGEGGKLFSIRSGDGSIRLTQR